MFAWLWFPVTDIAIHTYTLGLILSLLNFFFFTCTCTLVHVASSLVFVLSLLKRIRLRSCMSLPQRSSSELTWYYDSTSTILFTLSLHYWCVITTGIYVHTSISLSLSLFLTLSFSISLSLSLFLSLSLPFSLLSSSKIDRVNTTQQLSDLQKNHSVLFLLVHDEEVDADWHSVYVKMASEKALIAKFAFTTEPDIVKVRLL